MNKRTTKKIQPEQKLNSEKKADDVSPVIANTNVIGSQSPPMCLDEAILTFNAKVKLKDLKGVLDLVVYAVRNVDGFTEWLNSKSKSEDFKIVSKAGDGRYFDLSQLREFFRPL